MSPARSREHLSTSTRIHGRDWDTGNPVTLHLHDGRVAAVQPEETPKQAPSRLPWICPGLLDIQVNGFAGFDLNGESVTAADVRGVVEALWASGVPLCCPTIVTGSRERITKAMAAIAEACRDPWLDAAIAGVHLEGPYISPEDGPRGAHDRNYVRPPDWDEFQSWQEASGGRIRLITLSPEWEGATRFIARATRSGVVVAIGHTGATSEQIRAAVDSGARLSTHLGNGAHALLPRHPNYIWDQLACDELWASLIVDGHHLPAAVVKCFQRIKGNERLILITDAVSVAGLPPGRYRVLHQEVELTPQGRVQLLGQPYLAGSALRLTEAIANMRRFSGISLPEAVAMASLNPAQLLGITHRLGSVSVGATATFTLLEETGPAETGGGTGSPTDSTGEPAAWRTQLRPVATVLDGRVVWSAGAS